MVRADGCFQIQSVARAARPRARRDRATSALRPHEAWPRTPERSERRTEVMREHRALSTGSRAECESAPARRHTPPAFSTVGFVACLQKKLTKPPSTHPARRGRRESGVRGVGSHYADRYHDGMMVCHHTGLTISGLTNLLVRSGVCTRPLRAAEVRVVRRPERTYPRARGPRRRYGRRRDARTGGCAACTRGMQNGPVTNSNTLSYR